MSASQLPAELFLVVGVSQGSALEVSRVTVHGIARAWEHAVAVSWVGGASYLKSNTEMMIFREGRPVEWSRGGHL